MIWLILIQSVIEKYLLFSFDIRRVWKFWRRPSLQTTIRGPWFEVSLSGWKPVLNQHTFHQMALKRINKVCFSSHIASNKIGSIFSLIFRNIQTPLPCSCIKNDFTRNNFYIMNHWLNFIIVKKNVSFLFQIF